jgi:DNA-binding IclR family transcriptional regulator
LRSVFNKQRDSVTAAHLGADWKTFTKNLRSIRQEGYCVTSGEFRSGIVGLAAPLFNQAGEVLGSIALAGTPTPLIIDQYRTLAPVVIEAAQEITRRIGDMANAVVLPARSLR